jgi:hydroxymethylpyrimidine/phosphomethylpyrimidine kinase
LYDGENYIELTAPRLPVDNPHGVGCTFASAIAAELAKGQSPNEAVKIAHGYLHAALKGSLDWHLGAGRSPVNHGVNR